MKRFVVLVLLLQCACVRSELRFPTGFDLGANRASGRVDGAVSSWGFIVKPTSENWPQRDLNSSLSSKSSSACKETCGFLPCTESAVGNLFLMTVYGYLLLYVAASFLSDGSEFLFAVMGPGTTGGLFLPVTFPHALLIVAIMAIMATGHTVTTLITELFAYILDSWKTRPNLSFRASCEIFDNALLGVVRVEIKNLTDKAKVLGGRICVGVLVLVTLGKEIAIKLWSSPLLGRLIVAMLVINIIVLASGTDVEVGDRLPAECEYVLSCGLNCLHCQQNGPGFTCCP